MASPPWIANFKKWIEGNQEDQAKGCSINPGILIRFTKGLSSYDFVLCFHCSQWATFPKGGPIRHVHDFDSMTGANLIHEIYPSISTDDLYFLGQDDEDSKASPPATKA